MSAFHCAALYEHAHDAFKQSYQGRNKYEGWY